MTNLEKIRATVISAVPGIRRTVETDRGIVKNFDRPIQLADVLQAIPYLWVQPKDKKDGFRYINNSLHSTGIKWNLAEDLDNQSPEVLEFLAGILSV